MTVKINQNTIIVALVCAACFLIACVTALVALGRDASQVIYLVGVTLPATVASLAALQASTKAHKSAQQAVESVSVVRENQDEARAAITSGVAQLRERLDR